MPIYAYRCGACGHAKDVLRKLSDPALTTCPSCGAEAFTKQVTAAGFQLKGSGWYATDFRDAKKPTQPEAKPAESGAADSADAGAAKPAEAKPASPAEAKGDVAATVKPAPASPAAPGL